MTKRDYGFLIIYLLCFGSYFACLFYFSDEKSKKDQNLERVQQGHMSKVFYQDHSYVIWGINLGGGCVHDPDCQCFKEEK
jgi:hypothetical protein